MNTALIALIFQACTPSDSPPTQDTGEDTDSVSAGVVPVPASGPYGTHTFNVPAQTHWVNTGLYLRAGESVTVTTSGSWTIDDDTMGPEGDGSLGQERGCDRGALAVRSGLRFEDVVTCLGTDGTFTAATDDIIYMGMIFATDLGDTYGERLRVSGELEVTLSSEGDTVPTITTEALEQYDLSAVSSGWVEIEGTHNLVTIPAAEALADIDVAVDSMATLDAIYAVEEDLRGAVPYSGERVRWFPDASIESFAYMLAGNPTRCATDLMSGQPDQRILRAVEPDTDIWGFSHELGHSFSFVGGTWVYQYVNVESWPNLFTLRVLDTLKRTEGQPNYDSYCDGQGAYFSGGTYEELASDPFLQLCFLMDFEVEYGPTFYESFFRDMNTQTNDDVGYAGTDASVWRYVRDRFDLAAGEDTTPIFEMWGVELE